jgi:F-type H+-transporting ATPase subunit a
MPEHTSFLSYVAAKMFANWDTNVANAKCVSVFDPGQHDLKQCTVMGSHVTSHSFEPVLASIAIILLCLVLAFITRSQITKLDSAVVPERRLTIRTLVEYLVETFYDSMKEMMGAKRAKRYLPLIGTCAMFVFFSNITTLIPGFSPPTSNWSITMGCALVVFVAYHYYGVKENGLGYLKHFMGPMLVLAPLMFVIEMVSHFVRPITLSIRLMLNMAVDHLVLGIVLALIPLLVPIPLMILGTLVAVVQTFVFCLLATIYISMATEHEH